MLRSSFAVSLMISEENDKAIVIENKLKTSLNVQNIKSRQEKRYLHLMMSIATKKNEVLTALEGIQMDGQSFALYGSSFTVSDLVKFDLQFRTTRQEGILLWHKDKFNNNAIVIELENGQICTRVLCGNNVFSAKSQFKYGYLSNNNWHCLNVRICANQIDMSVDNRTFKRIYYGVYALNITGPLYICGFPDIIEPNYLEVRSKEFWNGGIRSLRINGVYVNWLPKSTMTPGASPEFRKLGQSIISPQLKSF
ncbi:hypothetical protein GJ496_002127 [Pomphorhynchus laevis]|nr:hypothetical protein GJ496_002127 [Pomphorhynchus laevis]